MVKTYKFRLYLTKEQEAKLHQQLDLHRYIYNYMLGQRVKLYKKKKVSLGYNSQQRLLPLLKDNKPYLKDSNAQALQQTVRRLDTSFKNFFRRIKDGTQKAGFPRFKGKDRFKSITYSTGFSLNKNKVQVSKIGALKFIKSREIKGKIKQVTLRKERENRFYVCFTCDLGKEKPKKRPIKKAVGIDMGVNRFATLSDENHFESEKHLEKRAKRLKLLQRQLSKKVKRSENFKKQKILISNQHEKIKDSRNDFLHKTSRKIIDSYDLVVIEKLKIKNMTRSAKGTEEEHGSNVKQKSGLNKSILDMSFGKFEELLSYKAEEAGKTLLKVDPKYTSKICSNCKEKIESLKKYREFFCPNCNLIMDRDLNASLNILERGLAELNLLKSTVRNTGINACGVLA